jgi:transcriptional antiterminator NusG
MKLNNSAWYVVRCGNSETKVRRKLQIAGFETYLPFRRYEIPNKRTRTTRTMEVPLIPRLIFVVVPNGNFGLVHDVEGVAGFLSIQGVPVEVPRWEVEDLQNREWDMQFDDTRAARIHRKEEAATRKETLKQKFPIGSPALFDGIFGDLVGIVVKHDKTGRFKLEIKAHGASITVDADPEKLRPAA